MCIYMYIYIYIFIYIYTYIYSYIHLFAYMCIKSPYVQSLPKYLPYIDMYICTHPYIY